MAKRTDAFYVGYLPLPGAMRRPVTIMIGVALISMIALATGIASRQQDPGTGTWSTSSTSVIEGYLSVDPYPILFVEDSSSPSSLRTVLLVANTKFGVAGRTTELGGKRVRAKGQFITLEDRMVFALSDADDALTALAGSTRAPGFVKLGKYALVGEIAGSKCFMGGMKPGFGKTHRACAVRCISGGIPPIFVTRDADGSATVYLLVDSERRAIHEAVLQYVAEPVELSGSLYEYGDMLVYSIDPTRIVRR